MRRRLATVALVAALACATGCLLFDKAKHARQPRLDPPTYSYYHLDGWQWENVDRVLVLPFLNQSEHTRAGEEVRGACRSELQRMGRFEVVAADPDDRAVLAAQIHRGGRFDEGAMLDIADYTKADVVIHGIITHYSPYPRPRIGLIIQAVSPRQAKVVASVDGVWDTTDCAVAERCRAYYRQRPRPLLPVVARNHVIVGDDGFAGELALESPALFQRWVCHEAVLTLLGFSVPSVLTSNMNSRNAAIAGARAESQSPCEPVVTAPQVGKVK